MPGLNDSLQDYRAVIEIMESLKLKEIILARDVSVEYLTNDKKIEELISSVGNFIYLLLEHNINFNTAIFFTKEERAALGIFVDEALNTSH